MSGHPTSWSLNARGTSLSPFPTTRPTGQTTRSQDRAPILRICEVVPEVPQENAQFPVPNLEVDSRRRTASRSAVS